jgi:hypothetical protein
MDYLDRDDRHAIEEARTDAFTTLLDLADSDEARANRLFTHLIAAAFCDHFLPDENGAVDSAGFIRMVNAGLAQTGTRYRLTEPALHTEATEFSR